MAEIEIKGLRKSFGNTDVIHGIDIAIADGEFIVIVGPSGCGKSTLLRMVAGLETVSGGEISIGGQVVNNLEPKERNIAMVFQNYALYPHMKVYDNMAYGLRIAGLSKADIEERVQRAAKMLELSPLLDRKPRQLSGGQRQRVAMGRAIVRDPQAFLFDEPLSNLDAKLRVQMRLEIKRLQRDLGTTSLYVTHDQVEAMTLADSLIVMNQGVAEQIDTPLAVYEHPASTFVAGFIGSPAMNFASGEVAEGTGGVVLDGGVTLNFGDDRLSSMGGRRVIVGLRPEHLRVANGEDALLSLNVDFLETLGADTLAYGHVAGNGGTATGGAGGGAEGAGSLMTVRLPGKASVGEGDVLPLVSEAGALHVFDAETGKRIVDL